MMVGGITGRTRQGRLNYVMRFRGTIQETGKSMLESLKLKVPFQPDLKERIMAAIGSAQGNTLDVNSIADVLTPLEAEDTTTYTDG